MITLLEPLLDAGLDLLTGGSCVGCARPGRPLCPACAAALSAGVREASPQPRPRGLAPAYVAGDYDGTLRALVLAHKERGALALARPLGRVLAEAVSATVRRPSVEECRVLLVPVPSRPAVVRRRGHDPMLRVSRVAAGSLRGAGFDAEVARLLRQPGRPLDQAGLGTVERRANLAGTMAVRTQEQRRVAARRVPVLAVVCDDVLTTGATAVEAQRALEAVGVPVAGIACVAATVLRRAPDGVRAAHEAATHDLVRSEDGPLTTDLLPSRHGQLHRLTPTRDP